MWKARMTSYQVILLLINLNLHDLYFFWSQFKPDIRITIETILIVFIFSSESRADKKSVASEHLHLQPENLPNN